MARAPGPRFQRLQRHEPKARRLHCVGVVEPGPQVQLDSRSFRILLAEDDEEMRRMVASALREDGHDVVELADGWRLLLDIAERLEAREAGPQVDLIVSDIRMPVCGGLQVLSALRYLHWSTPVILMTAFGDDATRRDVESLSAVLLDKPFELDDLRTAVMSLLLRAPPAPRR